MEKRYKVIIIDDEPIAIKVIENHLKKLEQFEIVHSFTNALEAIPELHSNTIDLLFLDIEMPGIKGLDFLKSLTNAPKTIFTTAYRDFAVEAFDLDVIDYLLKPVSFDRFLKAINRFLKETEINQTKENNPEEKYIQLKADKKIYKLNIDDILYIESLDDYIQVHTKSQKIISYERMRVMEERLRDKKFVRIHRSFLINKKYITAYSQAFVELGELKLSIGRTYKDKVIEILQ